MYEGVRGQFANGDAGWVEDFADGAAGKVGDESTAAIAGGPCDGLVEHRGDRAGERRLVKRTNGCVRTVWHRGDANCVVREKLLRVFPQRDQSSDRWGPAQIDNPNAS